MSLSDELETCFHNISTAMRDVVPSVETNYLHLAAKAKLAEAEALLHLAAELPYPFRKELRPIGNEINQFILAIEKRNARVIDEADGDVEDLIAKREQCEMWLDQARIMGVLTMVHLSRALDATQPPPANLKAV